MSAVITRQKLEQLIDQWIAGGKRVAGPRQVRNDCVMFVPLESSGQMAWDGFVHTTNSIKEFVFPRHEKLYGYRIKGNDVELYDCPPPEIEQVVIGARPCDAASYPILDPLFNWDYKDEFYNHWRKMTTVVTMACTQSDEHCFCTSVNLAPDAERGSDVMLFDLGDGSYEVRCLTDKGKALLAEHTESSDKVGQACAGPDKKLDLESVKKFVADNFENPQWDAMAMRCVGCGACAYNCPTCHCFDIVDEGNAAGGVRARNWDSCQYRMFTMHASGHNPRTVQGERQRQRIYHKFNMYLDKFGEILCTGCGNCSRNCPVSLGVKPVIEAIEDITSDSTVEAV